MILFIEVLRRVLALVGVLLAAWTAIYYVPNVVQLHPIDVAHEQETLVDREADSKRMMGNMVGKEMMADVTLYPEVNMDAEAFLAHITKGSPVVQVSGAEWKEFFDGVYSTTQRKPPDSSWRKHYGSSSLPDYLFFRRDDPRLQGATAPSTINNPVMYLTLNDGSSKRYIRSILLKGGDIPQESSSLVHAPYRQYAPWCLLFGILAYIIIPWPKRTGTVIAYHRASGIIAPDWMGMGLTGFFFALAMLVVSRDSHFSDVISTQGWAPLTAWSLLALLIGLPILLFSTANAIFAISLLPQGFRLLQWGSTRDITYSEINDAAFVTVGSAKWLRWFSLLMLLVNFLRAAPIVILLHRTYLYLEMHLRDGRTLRVPYEGLTGGIWLLREMREAGVQISDDIRDTVTEALNSGFPPRPEVRQRATLTAPLVWLILAGTTFFFWQSAPGNQLFAKLPDVPKRQLSRAELAAHHQIVLDMEESQQQVQEARERFEAATDTERDAAYDAYMKELDHFMELSKKADELEAAWEK